jgi:PTH1 family peptidyl-tRNA hydrolase
MKIVVGLGNPGRKYRSTRHNAGFLVVEALARDLRFDLSQEKYHAFVGKGRVGSEETVFALPQTYMNESGRSVGSILRYTNTTISDLIVVHDDLDLDLGSVRLKSGGGHGGHNGLRSIIDHVGSADFIRVRIGVGRPPAGMDTADYVLSPFLPAERPVAEDAVLRAADAVRAVILHGLTRTMNAFNKR